MHAPTVRFESTVRAESDRLVESVETTTSEWTTPDFIEESACAEICAYVFTG